MTDHACAVCFAALPPHLVGDLPAPDRLHAGVHLLCDRQECRDTLDADMRALDASADRLDREAHAQGAALAADEVA